VRLALASAVVTLALAGTARAEPVFDAFQKACLSTGGQSQAALAVTDDLKWQPLTKEQLAAFPTPTDPSAHIESVEGRLSAAPMMALVVANVSTTEKGTSFSGSLCAIAAPGADAAALKDEAAAYAKVPPASGFMGDANAVAFAWRDGPAGHQGLSPAEIQTSKSNAGVTVIAIGGSPQFSLIALLAPPK
jgi:hypothetical protein